MSCNRRVDGLCEIATQLVGEAIICADDAHEACGKCACPHTLNYVSASLAFPKVKDVEKRSVLKNMIQGGANCIIDGPGSQLTRILKYIGYKPSGQCDCEYHAHLMNEWGSERCRGNLNIIADWLEDTAVKQSWRFNRAAAIVLIQAACDLHDGYSWPSIVLRIYAYKID